MNPEASDSETEKHVPVDINAYLSESPELPVELLTEKFKIRSQTLIEKEKKEINENSNNNNNNIDSNDCGIDNNSETDVNNNNNNDNKIFQSVFGSSEKEPFLTNWNGEFKGLFIYYYYYYKNNDYYYKSYYYY